VLFAEPLDLHKPQRYWQLKFLRWLSKNEWKKSQKYHLWDKKSNCQYFCKTQHVDSSNSVRFDSFHWIVHIMRRRCRWGKVIDLINLHNLFWECQKFQEKYMVYLNVQRVDNIMNNQLKIWMTKPMVHISLSTCEIVVCDNHFMALQHELVNLGEIKKAASWIIDFISKGKVPSEIQQILLLHLLESSCGPGN